jgi:hypothetical protein
VRELTITFQLTGVIIIMTIMMMMTMNKKEMPVTNAARVIV